MNMEKVLITGAPGFIGSHLAKRLLQEGLAVVGIDNLNDYYDISLKTGRLNEIGINIHDDSGKFIQSDKYPDYR